MRKTHTFYTLTVRVVARDEGDDVRMSRMVSAPSANELARFYTGFKQSARPGAFPKHLSLLSLSDL